MTFMKNRSNNILLYELPGYLSHENVYLKELQQLMRKKGISDNRYIILSVTLDPEYDTDERINQYKELFDITRSNWLFLRGSLEETKKFMQNFNFYYEKMKMA